MKRINLNQLAVDVARKEGKKKQVDIAQIKEVMSVTLDELAKYNIVKVWLLMRSRKKRRD